MAELLDASGAPFALYSYDAYGNPGQVLTAATARISAPLAEAVARANALSYAGYTFDAHSGLHCLSKRCYDPATAQFLAKDPAKADGEESPYQYCGGDPVGKVDPSGERPRWVTKLARWAREFGQWAYGTARFCVSWLDAIHRFFWIRWAAQFDIDYQRRAAQQYMDDTVRTQKRDWIVDISNAFIQAGIECGYDYGTRRWGDYSARWRQNAIVAYSREFARRRLELVKMVASKA